MFFKLIITDNNSLIIFKFINMLFSVLTISNQMEEPSIIISLQKSFNLSSLVPFDLFFSQKKN